jgi:hypothetical protein
MISFLVGLVAGVLLAFVCLCIWIVIMEDRDDEK